MRAAAERPSGTLNDASLTLLIEALQGLVRDAAAGRVELDGRRLWDEALRVFNRLGTSVPAPLSSAAATALNAVRDAADAASWNEALTQLDAALGDILVHLQVAGPAPASPPDSHRCTDLGNARRLVDRHGRDLRYVPQWGWLIWDGRRWVRDDTGEVVRRAKDAVVNIFREAADIPDDRERRELVRWALRSESEARIRAMIALAQTEPGLPAAGRLRRRPVGVERGQRNRRPSHG